MNCQQAPFTITHLRAMVLTLSNSHFRAMIHRFPLSSMIYKGPHPISVETAYSHQPIGDSKSKTEKISRANVSHVVCENISFASPTELFISYFLICACKNKESLLRSLSLSVRARLIVFPHTHTHTHSLSRFLSLLLLLMLFSIFFDSYITFTHARSLLLHLLLCPRRVCDPSAQRTVCCLLSLFQQRKRKRQHCFFSL